MHDPREVLRVPLRPDAASLAAPGVGIRCEAHVLLADPLVLPAAGVGLVIGTVGVAPPAVPLLGAISGCASRTLLDTERSASTRRRDLTDRGHNRKRGTARAGPTI